MTPEDAIVIRRCTTLATLAATILFTTAAATDLASLYWQGRFDAVVDAVTDDGASLDRADRLLWLDALARDGRPFRAWPRLAADLADTARPAPDGDLLATAAAVHLALGRPAAARIHVEALLVSHPDHARGRVAAASQALHDREPAAAAGHVRALARLAGAPTPRLVSRLARAAARAAGDPAALRTAWLGAAAAAAAQGDASAAADHRTSAAMLEALGEGPFYRLSGVDGCVELPLHDWQEGVPYKCLTLELAGETFDVLLDTGNAVGWTIHEPRLLDLLACGHGRSTEIATGSVDTELASHELATARLPLGQGVAVHDLVGYYFAKPRDAYFDANLNPYLLRGCIVTVDFARDRLLLRAPDRFARDLAAVPPGRYARVPVGGSAWPFVPVTVGATTAALAMIETGAEDITLRLDFARAAGIDLEPAVMEWRGEALDYHTAPVTLQIGGLVLQRPTAPVWPVRFHENVSGLADHVMIGPAALDDRFALSFLPASGEVVLERVDR